MPQAFQSWPSYLPQPSSKQLKEWKIQKAKAASAAPLDLGDAVKSALGGNTSDFFALFFSSHRGYNCFGPTGKIYENLNLGVGLDLAEIGVRVVCDDNSAADSWQLDELIEAICVCGGVFQYYRAATMLAALDTIPQIRDLVVAATRQHLGYEPVKFYSCLLNQTYMPAEPNF
jgi:hypothetical protein